MAAKPRSRSTEAAVPSGPPTRSTHLARVMILADAGKKPVDALLRELEPWLAARVGEVRLARDVRAFYKERLARARTSEPAWRPDALVVLGGDGAILAAVRAFADEPVPTLGINFGRVGFLALAEAKDWRGALEELCEGRTIPEPRMRVEATFTGHQGEPVRAIALNDVVFTRGAFQGMLTLALRVRGSLVTNYRADGLIVATPTGSSAYSLAAGGPLLAPAMEGLVVTPVCPQALSHRPIVLGGDEELEVVVAEASGVTTLVVDGQGFYPMEPGGRVVLRRHPAPWPLHGRPGHDPYQRWRARLGWRGGLDADTFPSRDLEERVDPGDGTLL